MLEQNFSSYMCALCSFVLALGAAPSQAVLVPRTLYVPNLGTYVEVATYSYLNIGTYLPGTISQLQPVATSCNQLMMGWPGFSYLRYLPTYMSLCIRMGWVRYLTVQVVSCLQKNRPRTWLSWSTFALARLNSEPMTMYVYKSWRTYIQLNHMQR